MIFLKYLILSFLSLSTYFANGQSNIHQEETEIQSNKKKPSTKTDETITYNYELDGNLNPLTAKKVQEYILNKTGIYEANINVYAKTITLITNKDIDKTSVEGLLRYAHHLYLLENSHDNEK